MDEHAPLSGHATDLILRSIFDAAPDPVFLLEGDRFIDCNHRAEQMLGLERAQILGKALLELLQPAGEEGAEPERFVGEALRMAHAGSPQRFELVRTRSLGNPQYTEVHATSLQLGDRRLLLAIARDISDRKRIAAELEHSESRLRSLLDAIPDIVFIIGESGRCLYANPALALQTGYTKEDLRFEFGQYTAIHPDDSPAFDAFLRGLLGGAVLLAGPAEHRFSDKRGNIRWYSTVISKIEFEGRKALQFIQRDVTKNKAQEDALRLTQERFAMAFHATPDAMMIVSAEEPFAIIEVNDSFERIFGFTRQETIGNNAVDMGIWQDLADRDRFLSALRNREEIPDREVGFRRKSGELGVAELTQQLMEARGKPEILSIVRDVTDRKRAEAERATAFELVAKLKNELERERDYLREEVDVPKTSEIIGTSPAMRHMLARIDAVAGTDANVLITGESGVGKELVARAIHSRSHRSSKALVRVNCAAVPGSLFESEFFGHVKGAFTGAHRDRIGRFELADGGTLFLDEVAEIPQDLQGKLLRVLQEGEFERIGEAVTRKVEVRIIAATNRDLRKEMIEGRFRSDLYYRLSVFPLEVPPLRERKEDILPLAMQFLALAGRRLAGGPFSLTRAQIAALQDYDWPGNIRELQNVIERAVILSRGRRLQLDLAATSTSPGIAPPTAIRAVGGAAYLTEEEFRSRERENILAALAHSGWKISGKGGAAERLGIKPTTLTYRMKVHGLRRLR